MQPVSPRALAAQALVEVLRENATLSVAAERAVKDCSDRRDAALVKELGYGTLRFQPRLAALLARLLEQPLKGSDLDVEALLLLGLYQLIYMRVPDHAAVRETVEACRALKKGWAAGLVNGVLRRFLRERAALETAVMDDPAARYAHPLWFIEELRRDWPQHWELILAAGNERPPLTLRVNRARIERDAFLAQLGAANLPARACRHSVDGVVLDRPLDVGALPGFAAGLCSVQDEAAQLAAGVLDVVPGQRVLDACAAPGGKACHLLERHPGLALTLVERDSFRARRIHENLERLGLAAEVRVADAGEPLAWWDGAPFDRILLDAPCSASGVVRRHPDAKLRHRQDQLDAAVGLQRRLLDALWPLLAPRGKLVYATCSVFRRENAGQLEGFLAAHGDADALPLEVDWGIRAGAGRQILSGEDGMDGFYYACLQKRP
jgi:16S rRNA (cytosine967-C5)-methyltransferase